MKKSAKRIVSAMLSLCMVAGAFGSVSGKTSENGVGMNLWLPLVSAQESTENDVVLVSEAKDGACFYYKDSTNGLIIDGSGSFTIEELSSCLAQNKVGYIVVGKHVNIPVDEEIAPMNNFLLGYSYVADFLYGYAGSDIEDKLNSMLDYIVEVKNKDNPNDIVNRESIPFKINIVSAEINPCDVIPKEIPSVPDEVENTLGLCLETDSGVKFYYKKADRGLIIEGNGAFTLAEFETVKKNTGFNQPEYIVIGKDVVIPEDNLIPEGITDNYIYLNSFLMQCTTIDRFEKKALCSVYTYPGSDTENEFSKMIKSLNDADFETGDINSNCFELNIIGDEINPYDIKKTCDTTLFLRGDITGNGIVDVTDLTELSLYLIGDSNFDCAQKIYSDIDDDNKTGMTDLARLRQYISKLVENWEDYKIYK